ncbi:MAG: uracil-DNA glycosylase family protein [Prevotella sp.]|nr:uracil-DNA glycosylase family protein [Bacteroides sp.]MCM1365797.1 uracil-DNA glycosylase family protein [Prevotella sp.]MCM1436511.1 uracil-DNA glycosylase family protein [Prevotella sp.]
MKTDVDKAVPTEKHPLQPFLPADAKILICGTFPPQQKRWSMQFYYPNFINDFWRMMGIIFCSDKDALVDVANKTFLLDRIKRLLIEAGIAMSDTGKEVIRTRDNASDKYLEIIKPIDLKGTLELLPQCRAVVTTGEKAASIIAAQTNSKMPPTGSCVEFYNPAETGIHRKLYHWRMPSTSRAYPLPLANKAEAYKKMFVQTGVLSAE